MQLDLVGYFEQCSSDFAQLCIDSRGAVATAVSSGKRQADALAACSTSRRQITKIQLKCFSEN